MRIHYKFKVIVLCFSSALVNFGIPCAFAEIAPDAQSEYAKTLTWLESNHRKGHDVGVDGKFFSSLNWVGRTAAINYFCSTFSAERCHTAVSLGLKDNALVVRDHALRVMISGKQFKPLEKKNAAEKIITDDRNYRRGRAFWIVDRAKTFLSASNTQKSAK